MDLLYNSYLVENITNNENKMTLQDNGVNLEVTKKATVSGYKQDDKPIILFISGHCCLFGNL